MASIKTLELKRDRMLARMLVIKDVTPPGENRPNHKSRRGSVKNLARKLKLRYQDCRQLIKNEEAKYNEAGIDPFLPDAPERLKAHEEGHEYVSKSLTSEKFNTPKV